MAIINFSTKHQAFYCKILPSTVDRKIKTLNIECACLKSPSGIVVPGCLRTDVRSTTGGYVCLLTRGGGCYPNSTQKYFQPLVPCSFWGCPSNWFQVLLGVYSVPHGGTPVTGKRYPSSRWEVCQFQASCSFQQEDSLVPALLCVVDLKIAL